MKASKRLSYGLVVTSAIALLLGCSSKSGQKEKSDMAEKSGPKMIIPATEIHLGIDSTMVWLNEYLDNPAALDSVSLSSGYTATRLGDSLIISTSDDAQRMGILSLWEAGGSTAIPLVKSEKEQVEYSFDPNGVRYDLVQVKGEMNSWNPAANVLQKGEDGIYRTEFRLSPGRYQYKLMLEGQEVSDPYNPDSVDNGIGGFNNVLQVGELQEGSSTLRWTLDDDGSIRLNTDFGNIIAVCDAVALEIEPLEDGYRLELPGFIKYMKRSHVRAWAYDDKKVSNDILIPCEFGNVLTDPSDLGRMDVHGMTIYNVFMDRFQDGDPDNNRPITTGEVLPQANDMGGDIRGAIQKLEDGYFDELGINTLWISPIVKNVQGAYGQWPDPETKFSAYHGYWPISFTLVDPRFGNSEELKELVKKAHDQDMNVLLDFVANHVHIEHPYYKAHPEVATELYLPDGSLNTERWDEYRLTTWFDTHMPSLRLDDPAVYEMLTDSAVFWIEEYDFDGFRHDATKHVPEIFWKVLTRKLKDRVISKGKPLYQIGETYGSRELVASYLGSGKLDAQFDFNLYDACLASLANPEGSMRNLDDAVKAGLKSFGHHHLMGNITGNQDRARFISYAGGALRFDEDAKVAGWTREVGVGAPVAYERSKQLFAVISTIPGIPVIYYGDEIGDYGGNDPDNRKMMRFDDLGSKEKELKRIASYLIGLRGEFLPLIYGDFRTHLVDDTGYIYSRNYIDQTALVIINGSNEERTFTFELDTDQGDLVTGNPFMTQGLERDSLGTYTITLPSNAFEIITR